MGSRDTFLMEISMEKHILTYSKYIYIQYMLYVVGTYLYWVELVYITCTGWSLRATDPMPSTVVTAERCSEHTGARQPFTEV